MDSNRIEGPSDKHQPLLRTLTRLDDDSERLLQAENDVQRDLDQLVLALKNREELEAVYNGISVIVTFFSFQVSFFLSFHPHLSELRFTYL